MTTKIDYSDYNDVQSNSCDGAIRCGEEVALPQKIIVLYFTTTTTVAGWFGVGREWKKPER